MTVTLNKYSFFFSLWKQEARLLIGFIASHTNAGLWDFKCHLVFFTHPPALTEKSLALQRVSHVVDNRGIINWGQCRALVQADAL